MEKHIEEFEIDCEAEVMILKAKQNLALACHNVFKKDFKEARAYFDIAKDLALDAEGRDCAGEIQDEATELIKDIEARLEKAERKAQESTDVEVSKSASSSDLTSKVADKLAKMFSFR